MALSRNTGLLKRGLLLLESSERVWLRSSPRQATIAATWSTTQASSPTNGRAFSNSSTLYKKGKAPRASNSAKSASGSEKQHGSPASGGGADAADPLDTTPLTAAFASVDAHHREQLQTLLRGGRFNPNSLGALPVSVKTEDGTSATFPLRELAQVVPRSGSRTVSLLLNDREYIKPVMSAIQASPEYNQQPQRAEDNELELLLKVEAERADELVRLVKENMQVWREQVRQARRKHDKVLKDAKKGGLLPDVLRAAEKEVQKVQDQKMKEIDEEEKKAIKQIGQRKS